MINKLLKPIARFLPENNRYERIWKLAQIDFKKRYYNDKLGLLWAILLPLQKIAIYYTIFTYVFEHEEENYGLFLFCGLICWTFFVSGANKGMEIIRSKLYLIENIQFKKIDLFISLQISQLLGYLFQLFVFLLAVLISGIPITVYIFYLPIIILNIILLSAGVGMILATIVIYLKDIKHAWDVVTLIGFWSSGVFFRGEKFQELFPPFMYLNPFVGIIINTRNILMFEKHPDMIYFVWDFIYGLLVFFIGRYLFEKNWQNAIERM